MNPMPSPPFPDRDSQMLGLIITNAINALKSGETTTEGAILHAAVHGWYEGHIEGEDACPGCDFRGDLRKQRTKGVKGQHDFPMGGQLISLLADRLSPCARSADLLLI